ncbi:MAG: uroporphyrinogen-III decarboxylase-like protein [candidate division WOR-3 bacterium]|nr:uroporphyrinogen-III decarboxylase-like protein [candidate division WOR-3 bacterium]
MTARERWKAALEHREADRVPTDYWATPEFSAKLIRRLGFSDKPEAELVADLKLPPSDNNVRPSAGFAALRRTLAALEVDFTVKLAPCYAGPDLAQDCDEFGCRHREVSYGAGTYDETVSHPLAGFDSVEAIERSYKWPEPEWWDYGTIAQQARDWAHHPIQCGGSEPFMVYKDLRGEEQAYIDLKRNTGTVHYCMGRLFELAWQKTRLMLEQLPPGLLLSCYVAEDMGFQSGLMISPADIREFLLPGMKRMVELARKHNALVFHHNDGAIAGILPDLVALGIDVLNPVQWRASGMDRKKLKADYGDRLVFHGAMDNQKTLPFGTVEDVREEVRDNIRMLGRAGGYVLAPCHNIQPITPVDNVIAMYETARTSPQ